MKLPNYETKDKIQNFLTASYSGFIVGPMLFGVTVLLLGELRWAISVGAVMVAMV